MVGFSIISADEAERKISAKEGAIIVYVNRLDEFSVPKDVVERYEDIKRRYGTKPNANRFAFQGSNFDARYRMKLVRSGKAQSKIKDLIRKSRTQTVYLVKENDRPDIAVLLDVMQRFMGQGVV